MRTAEALQWVGYAVGGALAVGGVIALVVHALSGQAETPSPSAFGCEPGISGVACHGRF